MGIKPILILRQIEAGHLRRATKNPIAGLTFYQILVTGGRLVQTLRPSTSLVHAPRRIQPSLSGINRRVAVARPVMASAPPALAPTRTFRLFMGVMSLSAAVNRSSIAAPQNSDQVFFC